MKKSVDGVADKLVEEAVAKPARAAAELPGKLASKAAGAVADGAKGAAPPGVPSRHVRPASAAGAAGRAAPTGRRAPLPPRARRPPTRRRGRGGRCGCREERGDRPPRRAQSLQEGVRRAPPKPAAPKPPKKAGPSREDTAKVKGGAHGEGADPRRPGRDPTTGEVERVARAKSCDGHGRRS